MYLTHSLVWAAVALAAVWALVLAAYDYPNSADLRSCLTEVNGLALGRLAGLARLALPLGIVSFLISLNTNIPRYFVEDLLGTKA